MTQRVTSYEAQLELATIV